MGDVVNKVFGGPDVDRGALRSFRPTQFTAGGLETRLRDGRINVTSTPERQQLVSGLAGLFRDQAGEIQGLRDDLAPGFGALTRSRVDALRGRGRRAVGNLRENLASRRVLGSSFAQDALTRAESEFAREEDAIRAESFLQELEATTNLINQEFTLRQNAVNTALSELNLQADVAQGLSSQATQALQRNAEVQASLAQEIASGFGELIGTVGSAALMGGSGG